jgi:hypothetical protein
MKSQKTVFYGHSSNNINLTYVDHVHKIKFKEIRNMFLLPICGVTAQVQLSRLVVEVSRLHKDTHTGRTPLIEKSSHHRGRYLHNIQQTQETNIQAFSGIRTCDPSNRATTKLCFRQHGHREWHTE